MKQRFIIKNNQKRLLLFFAGWGMDETPFRSLHPSQALHPSDCNQTTDYNQSIYCNQITDCDWMICYDYRTLEFDAMLLEEYIDITLIAWSMGVWVASHIMQRHPHLPVSKSIAINGTTHPIHETKGIAPTIFEGTLQGLNEQTLLKFQRRMCSSTADYEAFRSVAPQRPADELKEELAAIQQHYLSSPPSDFCWQKAIIGNNDRIFLPDHQWLAWRNKATIEMVDAAHYQKELFEKVLNNACVG